MIAKVILWLCVIWVPIVEYIFLANETKFKKNIAVGVTLPYEGRHDPEIQGRLKRFRRQLGAVCLVLTALALTGLLLPLSIGVSLTLMLVWTDLAVVIPMIPYALCNRDLKRIKARRGWRRLPEGTVTVDLTAAAQPGKELSFLNFLPPMLISLIPVVWEALAGVALRVVMMLNPLYIFVFYLIYRFGFRRRSEVVDSNTSLTETLTRLRRRYWRRTWLWVSWYMGLISLGMELYYCAPLAGGVAVGVLTLGLMAVCFRLELGLRRAQEKLTADSGTGWYADEDDKWLLGMFYYNPHDRRLMVNDRVGVNTTMNLARRSGQVIMGLVAALLIFMPLLGGWLVLEERAEVTLSMEDTVLTAAHGGSRYEIPLDSIADAELLKALPGDLRRVVGTAMDNVLKGRFRSEEYGQLTLCLDPGNGPWLLVRTQSGTLYLLGSGRADEAELAFQLLK